MSHVSPITTPVPWSMKKPGPIRAPGWMSMPVLRVGVLRHHARDQRHAQQQQFVGDAVDRHRLQAGIAEDDLVMALGGRVALERRLRVLFQDQPHVRQPLQQLDRLLLGQRLQVERRTAPRRMVQLVLVAQGAGDLLRQLVVQAVDQVADVVLDVADVQVLPPPVAGIEDVEQVASGSRRRPRGWAAACGRGGWCGCTRCRWRRSPR